MKVFNGVFDRHVYMFVETGAVDGHRVAYDVYLNGKRDGQVHLAGYCWPTMGYYGDGWCAIWAGKDLAVWKQGSVEFAFVALPDSASTVYRLERGWCVVAEISVCTLDVELCVRSREIHNEVISSSWWESDTLMLTDFEGVSLSVSINPETLLISQMIKQ